MGHRLKTSECSAVIDRGEPQKLDSVGAPHLCDWAVSDPT